MLLIIVSIYICHQCHSHTTPRYYYMIPMLLLPSMLRMSTNQAISFFTILLVLLLLLLMLLLLLLPVIDTILVFIDVVTHFSMFLQFSCQTVLLKFRSVWNGAQRREFEYLNLKYIKIRIGFNATCALFEHTKNS